MTNAGGLTTQGKKDGLTTQGKNGDLTTQGKNANRWGSISCRRRDWPQDHVRWGGEVLRLSCVYACRVIAMTRSQISQFVLEPQL